MKFLIQVDMSNAAFEELDGSPELSRILRELADTVERGGVLRGDHVNLRDINGNRVGWATVDEA